MKIDIITLFPELIDTYAHNGIIGRAAENSLLSINYVNLRDFSEDKHKRVDDYPYGGGPGMLLKPEPLYNALRYIKKDNSYVIYLSPKGNVFNQQKAKEYTKYEHIIFIVGHYEGIDQRIIDMFVDEEVSIGDYVLTSGELPALIIADAVGRLIPGVLGSEESIVEESHSSELLEYPQYTRPEEFMGHKVPEIILSGNHQKIKAWRELKSVELTLERRKDKLSNISQIDIDKRCEKLNKIINRK
ncbi:tRNA (guanosine(37)-N1)-methyltransferase TrmD [Sedimentibacter sp. zth1]|uniref:tRNA (guanosine(37)-N1)-methyltransferase TrmD n=1 Tax=Sedimentibacter sp. zth1 TaxID=2816908 RepID=UPI001A91E416|nr:tRNA (guanosine(37)-N1)-methyltransferase TrmD [Sedimentibacter sp. zth1]QSX06573.1 tRNA (guanosine(37)-N1)-methyltransferase TrmD [Sedimentibacter sp. zth1]